MSSHHPDFENLSDEELIRITLLNDLEGFHALVLRYQTKVFSMLMRQVRDEEVARELTQDVFLKVHLNLRKFRFKAKFATWLTRITLNTANAYFSSRRFKEHCRTDALSDRQINTVAECDEGQQKEFAERNLQLALSKLKSKYRDVTSLYYFEGKSYEECSAILEIPVGTVASRMNTAVRKLRELLGRL